MTKPQTVEELLMGDGGDCRGCPPLVSHLLRVGPNVSH